MKLTDREIFDLLLEYGGFENVIQIQDFMETHPKEARQRANEIERSLDEELEKLEEND